MTKSPPYEAAALALRGFVERHLRRHEGATLAAIERAADLAHGRLTTYLSGERRPRLDDPKWRQLCDALDLAPQERRSISRVLGADPALFDGLEGA